MPLCMHETGIHFKYILCTQGCTIYIARIITVIDTYTTGLEYDRSIAVPVSPLNEHDAAQACCRYMCGNIEQWLT